MGGGGGPDYSKSLSGVSPLTGYIQAISLESCLKQELKIIKLIKIIINFQKNRTFKKRPILSA